jgi:FG-GAP-like repeat
MKRVAAVLAVGVLAATSAWAAGLKSPGFKGPKYYKATGIHLYPVAVADMNGDGRQDIVVGSEANKTVSLLYGKKGGGFTAPHNHHGGPYPFWISIADFNHDHHPDIAIASYSNPGKVVVLLSRHGGGYSSHSYAVGGDPYAIAVGDFNRDGNKDLAVVDEGSDQFSILVGRHDGAFRNAVNYPTGTSPVAIVAHDFNGDGKEDLAILHTTGSGSQVELFDGRGDGTFKKKGSFNAGAMSPEGMTAGRFSGGKLLDLAVPDCAQSPNRVYVLDGTKSGGFSSPHHFPIDPGSCSYESAVGDLNGDGRPDLVTAIYSGSNTGDIEVMYGKGGGKLSAPRLFNATSGDQNYSIAIGQLNGDKRPDLVVPDYDKQRVAVLYGKP